MVHFPESDGLTVVRCLCGYKIRLDEPEDDEDDRPRKGRRPARRPRRHGAEFIGKLPLLLLGSLCGLLILLTPFFVWATAAAMLLGLPIGLWALIMVFRQAKREGLEEEMNSAGRYHFGNLAGWAVIGLQIGYAFQWPRVFAAWVVLELLGMIMLVESITVAVILKVHDKPAEQLAASANPFPGNPNPGPQNPNPQAQNPAQANPDAALDKALADLGSPERFVAAMAIDPLAGMTPNQRRPEVAQKLAAVLASPDKALRRDAIKALGVWGTANEIPALIEMLADRETMREALQVIGRFRDPRAVEPVVRCFRDDTVMHPAQDALREMGPMAEKAVLPILQNLQDINRCRATIDLLKDIGTQESVPALQALVASNDLFLSGAAREAIAAITARTKG
jgi:hypothetical protein